MGAFPWKAVVPFAADAEAALHQVQQEALRTGAYGKPYDRGQPKAATIADLREACAEDGTCSIIDVVALGERPGPGVAGPFPRAALMDVLGTCKPTRADALASRSELYEKLERGEAAYIVCYENGEPSDVLFLGYSFD